MRKAASRTRQLRIESLEHRRLMHGDAADHGPDLMFAGPPVLADKGPGDVSQLFQPPALSSNPDASAALYLDFNGHFESGVWAEGQRANNISVPVFSRDANITFSVEELEMIEDIWAAVAEDFAPFDINVTTVNPGSFEDGKALRVAIGETGKPWFDGDGLGGIAMLDSFTNPEYKNTVFVFPDLDEDAFTIASAVSHESGHAFGLYHQALVDADTGEVVQEYYTGTPEKSPIMGDSKMSERSIWWEGTGASGNNEVSVNENSQDDLAVISREENGFGYRPDDHGSNFQSATPLSTNLFGEFRASGIVEKMDDADVFSFHTDAGTLDFHLNVAEIAPNLDSRLELWSATSPRPFLPWALIASSDPTDDLNASIRITLEEGDYYLVVRSHGKYGDLGQYTLTGVVNQPLVPPTGNRSARPPEYGQTTRE